MKKIMTTKTLDILKIIHTYILFIGSLAMTLLAIHGLKLMCIITGSIVAYCILFVIIAGTIIENKDNEVKDENKNN